jgi:flagellin
MQVNTFNSSATIGLNQHKKEIDSDFSKISSGKNSDAKESSIVMIAHAMMSGALVDSQGIMNANDSIGMMQIADGVLSNVSQMSTKLQDLSVASNNAALNTTQRDALNLEFNSILDAIDSSIESASFNGKSIFGSNLSFSLGDSEISVSLDGINSSNISIDSQESIEDFTTSISQAMSEISSAVNSADKSINSMMNSATQKMAASSQLSDTDMAKQIGSFEQNNIKLDISLIMQSHQKNISSQRMQALLN